MINISHEECTKGNKFQYYLCFLFQAILSFLLAFILVLGSILLLETGCFNYSSTGSPPVSRIKGILSSTGNVVPFIQSMFKRQLLRSNTFYRVTFTKSWSKLKYTYKISKTKNFTDSKQLQIIDTRFKIASP